ncbi:MAG: DUF2142 domain-containing protein [Phycisphaerae bacterium]|nr:DUF2142 domain-containing protein [Phycisphaerae bacterium]MDD5381673.1 DUF2142 domain-containing protein [Phycisphaerae bacterium]
MFNHKINPPASHEYAIVFVLCIIAAVRIFIFNAAFPLFNNVDEDAHFDLVYKYSNGQIPRAAVENFSRESAELILLYGTTEYVSKPEQILVPIPLWAYPNLQEILKSQNFADAVAVWQNYENHETASFPVYYMVAGIWCSAGRILGISGGQLIYWIRFLNVPLFTLLVWFSYRLGRTFYPDGSLLRIGLPLFVAFFPQDAFYSINSDAISSLLFAISFFLLLQIYFESKSVHYHLLTGLAAAATLLVKLSNIAMLVLLCVIVVLKVRKLFSEKKIREYLPRLCILLAAVVVPVGIWLLRNYLVFGDITGTKEKIEFFGWVVKPLGKLSDHPIFTYKGLCFFLAESTKTFWRGEFVWHIERMAWWGADLFYVVSSAVLVTICGFGVILNRNKTNGRYRFVLVMSFLVVGTSVAFLAFLSILYDFNDCPYPSRELPYFVSGRLIAGALLPFLLIYIEGLEYTFRRLGRYAVLLAIAVLAVGITLSELWLTAEIFSNPFNWFYLR